MTFTLSFREFLEFAESFYLEAENHIENGQTKKAIPFIVSCILLSWISIESFINNMAEDFAALPKDLFTLQERAFLEEKAVEFLLSGQKAGEFQISKRSEFRKIDEKILFLVAKFGKGRRFDKGSTFWQQFENARKKRNFLTHPRKSQEIDLSLKDAKDSIEVAKSIIKMVAEKVWGKKINL